MKKSLFALAAATALVGAAQAQSSVTVYGILDMGYIGSNVRENPAGGGAVTKVEKSAFGASAEQTSRLGFKGTEDLGGGSSAFFTVELGLTPADGHLSGGTASDSIQKTTNASGTAVDNRQSFVGLKKNGVGQFALGRQYTTVFNAAAATSVGQLNNVIGDAIYGGATGAWSAEAGGFAGGSGQSGQAFTNRADNTLSVQSANFAGFTGSGFYALNNSNQSQTAVGNASTGGGNANWNGWGLGADFTWQKLYVTAAYQSFKTLYSNGVTGAPTTVNLGSVGATTGQATGVATTLYAPSNISDKQTFVGATYDFGILKAYANWLGRKVQNDTASSMVLNSFNSTTAATVYAGQQVNRNAQQIGVRSYITPAIESWASVGNGKYTGAIGSAGLPGTVSFTAYQLGTNYYLSKRTNLYGIFGSTTSTSSTGGTLGSGNTGNQYAVGVRHTF